MVIMIMMTMMTMLKVVMMVMIMNKQMNQILVEKYNACDVIWCCCT